LTLISLVRCESYNVSEVKAAVMSAVSHLGGFEQFVRPGDRVLLKANMLCARVPEKRVTTDPAVVGAVAALVRDAGGVPFVGDSPGIGIFSRIAQRTGIADAAREAGIECRELVDPKEVKLPEKSRFKRLEIASAAMEADVIINLPKLKTHCQMLLTLGVKNMYGVIAGKQKVEWHHMAGVDRETFASLLLDIYAVTKPALTILDGIWGMEGRGPSNGVPRKLNVIAAAEDAVAMDVTICRMLGGRISIFPLYRAASGRRLGETDSSRISFPALSPDAFSIEDFKFPELDTVHMFPASWDAFTRRFLVSKPVHREQVCTGCGRCEEICPEHAIERKNNRVRFDYSTCIRCYCCQEICPENAIDFKKGVIVRILGLLDRWAKSQ
jgi:uncharacterized protein (DUF362 family)/Pyruvate/2-oxoacid:ferredoxin oxidoreductase delta subunit